VFIAVCDGIGTYARHWMPAIWMPAIEAKTKGKCTEREFMSVLL